MHFFINTLLDFFIPRICIVCNDKLSAEDDSLCPKCLHRIKRCQPDFIRSEYKRKFKDENVIKDFISLFIFDDESPLKILTHELKYGRKFRLGGYLGELIFENLKSSILAWNADYIIPVPLHKLKKAERGFNQSYFIAKSLGKQLNIPVRKDIIKRIKFTSTQTTLDANARIKNMKGAFAIQNRNIPKGKNIILIDDVITTGSTVSECARVLSEYDTGNIYAVSAGLAN